MRPIIVGIDPGTTCAFAAFDFDFNLIVVNSKKDYSLAGLIHDIYKVGNPVLVGTDKKDIPSFVKEFSQKTGAKIYNPKYDTKKGEKLHIVKERGFLRVAKNTHETDAIASAIFAYNDYLPLIRKVKDFVKKNEKISLFDKLIIKVIVEEKNIVESLAEIEKKTEKKIIEIKNKPIEIIKEKKELSPEQKEILLLRKSINRLREKIKELTRPKEIVDIDKEIKKIIAFKEKRALMLQKEIRALKKQLEVKDNLIKKLDSFLAEANSNYVVKKLKNLGKEEYTSKKDILKIQEGDILYIEDLSVFSEEVVSELIAKIKPKAIISKMQNKFLSQKFFIINVPVKETKYFALADKDAIESEIQKCKKSKIILDNILGEYRKERRRGNIGNF